jgi:hypothetical protein
MIEQARSVPSGFDESKIHHRDTEDTEIAQRL